MEGKAALVTGAGSGIGREIARSLAREGYALTLVGRDPAKLEETAAMLESRAVQVIAADVGDPTSAQAIVHETLRRWGRLDVLVNNAGRAKRKPIADTKPELLQELLAVNFIGPALLIAAAWPHFLKEQRGVIVNISSLAAIDPFAGYFAYGASKAALESLARSIAAEGAPLGICAYNVALGAVDTALLDQLFSEEDIPRHKRRPPAEVAAVVLRCIAGKTDTKNGGTLVVPNL